MKTLRQLLLIVVICAAPVALHAQEFKIFSQSFQVHGFVSQGFAYTNQNNWLTMDTTSGSFGMTDFGVNISTRITDKFHVGAQLYDRNLGQLGKWHPQLDWALGDYRFTSWFGIRAGKVKTPLGLYTDTQDQEFLHTWALLPQGVYPSDLRAETIAHTGGDVYGKVRLKKLGQLSYTAYVGKILNDPYGGYAYGIAGYSTPAATLSVKDFTQLVEGADVRWTTPLKGLMIGYSTIGQDQKITVQEAMGPVAFDVHVTTPTQHSRVYYAEYTVRHLTLDGEFRTNPIAARSVAPYGPPTLMSYDSRNGFASGAYRLTKWLELGTYHSWYYYDWASPHSLPSNHEFDQAVTARFDFNRFVDLKVEEHFLDGYGSSLAFRGFYPQQNPNGLKPRTDALVVRTGFNF